jgi:hypothetical protein
MGERTKRFFLPTSTAAEVAQGLMNLQSVAGDNRAHTIVPVTATAYTRGTDRATSSESAAICPIDTGTVVTDITFNRYAHDIPSVGVYADLIGNGDVMFETSQYLNCDCTASNCNGTFVLGFDGQISNSLPSYANGTLIRLRLQELETVTSIVNFTQASIAFNSSVGQEDDALCRAGLSRSFEFLFKSKVGNVPRMTLWSNIGPTTSGRGMISPGYDTSAIGGYSTLYYSTDDYDSYNVLSITTNDGRDDNFAICNGVGTCDYDTGQCQCPFPYGYHAEIGPCGRIQANSSSVNGAGRCPGLVSSTYDPYTNKYVSRELERKPRVFASSNRPLVLNHEQGVMSRVTMYAYDDGDNLDGGSPGRDMYRLRSLFNLTSDSSAGPIAYDANLETIFFADNNPSSPFIGRALISDNNTNNWDYFYQGIGEKEEGEDITYIKWINVGETITGIAIDPSPGQRRLYWCVKGIDNVRDGKISFAFLDDTSPEPYTYHLTGIPTGYLIDPKGLAIHTLEYRIYWTDIDVSDQGSYENPVPVIRSARLSDQQGVGQYYLDSTIDGHSTSSSALVDIAISYAVNNTAIVIDAGSPPAILAIPLNQSTLQDVFIDKGQGDDTNQKVGQRVIASGLDYMQASAALHSVIVDESNPNLVLWSDATNQTIMYGFVETRDDVYGDGRVEDDRHRLHPWRIRTEYTFDLPVGLAFDNGYGKQTRLGDGDYLECYGNGECISDNGQNYCKCHDGYIGNCESRACPVGKAWWHEPIVDQIAHDVEVECSNMGICDRQWGICQCVAGFEGAACERMSCRGQTALENSCFGKGYCRSLRELAKFKKNEEGNFVAQEYGSNTWDPNTWDADIVQGCYGETYGYYPDGNFPLHNVSSATHFEPGGVQEGDAVLECPFGLDLRENEYYLKNTSLYYNTIWEYNHQLEVQQLNCTANSGAFTLSFRNHTTISIAYSATPATLAAAITALPSVGAVYAYIKSTGVADHASSETTAICSNDPDDNHHVNIVFQTEMGDVPTLTTVDNTLAHGSALVFTIGPIHEAIGKVVECSGKGECDRTTGVCACWAGWGSSDGQNARGTRGDCGVSLIQ